MKIAFIILGFIALATAAPKSNNLGFRNLYKQPIAPIKTKVDPRIIGGQEADPHSIPYQAFLEVYSTNEGWYCGGSLISENYVITAGHCGADAVLAYVTLGAHYPQRTENTQLNLESRTIIVHERYDSKRITNDVGLIRLSEAVRLSNAIQIIALPSGNNANNDFAGTTARASGWGLTNPSGTTIASALRYVDVQVITNSECERSYGSLESSILCTSGRNNIGTCQGDSGGPLAANGILIGITSFGAEHCAPGYPSAFSRVTSFLDWIRSNSDVKI